jgi:hypothetical protein
MAMMRIVEVNEEARAYSSITEPDMELRQRRSEDVMPQSAVAAVR